MAQVLYLFHENAADLFLRKVPHQDTFAHPNNIPLKTRPHRPKPPPNVRTLVIAQDLDPEDFPWKMSRFAEDITAFLEYLNEFLEFTDEVVIASISAFQVDLKVCLDLPPRLFSLMLVVAQYWASCLGQYAGMSIIKRDFPDLC